MNLKGYTSKDLSINNFGKLVCKTKLGICCYENAPDGACIAAYQKWLELSNPWKGTKAYYYEMWSGFDIKQALDNAVTASGAGGTAPSTTTSGFSIADSSYCSNRYSNGGGKCMLGMGGCADSSQCCTVQEDCPGWQAKGFTLTYPIQNQAQQLECRKIGNSGVCCYKNAQETQCIDAYNAWKIQFSSSSPYDYTDGSKITEAFEGKK